MQQFLIELGDKFLALVDEIKYRRGLPTRSEVIRRAVATYAFLTRQMQECNLKLALINDKDEIVKEIILP